MTKTIAMIILVCMSIMLPSYASSANFLSDEDEKATVLTIERMLKEHEKGQYFTYEKVCSSSEYNMLLELPCRYITFKRDGTPSSLLVKYERIGDSSAIGVLFGRYQNTFYDEYGFQENYMHSIKKEAEEGNRDAIRFLFEIDPYTGGWYSEYIDDLQLEFIEESPIAVIENWDIINKNLEHLIGPAIFSKNKNEFIKLYVKACKKHSTPEEKCKKIATILYKEGMR